MAIELKEKKYTETSLWISILLYVSIGLLILMVVSFFLFNYLNSKSKAELKNIESGLSQGVEIENKLRPYQQKIEDFSKIISERKDILLFVSFFEKICHPLVWVQDLQMDVVKQEISFSGKTENFISLGQQYLFLKSHQAINSVDLSNIEIDEKEGGVKFSFSLKFNDQVFKEEKKEDINEKIANQSSELENLETSENE